jgi:hypothetical protein
MSPLLPPDEDPSRLRARLRARFTAVAVRLASGLPIAAEDAHLAGVLDDHPEARAHLAAHGAEGGAGPGPEEDESAFFLHLALHVALREQAAADLPPGIRALYEAYLARAAGDRLRAEHRMLPALEEAVARSLAQPGGDDPQPYLEALRRGLAAPGRH